MLDFDLAAVPGVPETTLPDHLLPALPDNHAPAPWRVRGSSVVWRSKVTPAATEALPTALRTKAKVVSVMGGLVRYDESPVGSYDEVFGVIACRIGATVFGNVAFMAVDSPASLVGGRANWSMPKTLAKFEGSIASGESMNAMGETGSHWGVSANPRVIGPPLPYFSRARVIQQFPDGTLRGSRQSMRGWMRIARVQVAVEGEHLPEWLLPGSHAGAVIGSMKFGLGVPELFFP